MQIMEELGGDKRWRDRFLAQHASIAYYWGLVLCFFISPKQSYRFSEMLESATSLWLLIFLPMKWKQLRCQLGDQLSCNTWERQSDSTALFIVCIHVQGMLCQPTVNSSSRTARS